MTKNYGKRPVPYELLLVFDRFQYLPKDVYKKLFKRGYSRATIYKFHRRWKDANMVMKEIQKEL